MSTPYEVLDAQVHVWEPHHPDRPWANTPVPAQLETAAPFFAGTNVVTADQMIAMMDEIGVSGAILVNSTRHYGTDNSYALEAAARRPDRFRVVVRVDASSRQLRAETTGAADDPLVVGVRVMTLNEADRVLFREGGFDEVFAAAEDAGIPLCIYPAETLPLIARAAQKFPDLRIVVDHLGLLQRPMVAPGSDMWGSFPDLLALAQYPNVAVKLSSVPALSWQPYPYPDVWPNVRRVLDAFGVERVMWGSDYTRVVEMLTYGQSLGWLIEQGELSGDELAALLGGTLRAVFGWQSSAE